MSISKHTALPSSRNTRPDSCIFTLLVRAPGPSKEACVELAVQASGERVFAFRAEAGLQETLERRGCKSRVISRDVLSCELVHFKAPHAKAPPYGAPYALYLYIKAVARILEVV